MLDTLLDTILKFTVSSSKLGHEAAVVFGFWSTSGIYMKSSQSINICVAK